jgi:hypothetical protein
VDEDVLVAVLRLDEAEALVVLKNLTVPIAISGLLD